MSYTGRQWLWAWICRKKWGDVYRTAIQLDNRCGTAGISPPVIGGANINGINRNISPATTNNSILTCTAQTATTGVHLQAVDGCTV